MDRFASPRARTLRRACATGIAASLAACAAQLAGTRAAGDVVEAERAFARLADEIGVRAAFAANFADDGVWMLPGPTTLAAAHSARPAPADPRAVRLEWDPAIAGVAASGDVGFTSGPSRMSMRDGSRPARYGAYFSVWTRNADGRWKVAIDAGVRSTTPIADAAMQPGPVVHAAPGGAADTIATLFARERGTPWDRARWRETLADDALMLADDARLARGAAIAEALVAAPIALEPLGGRMAASADLAYTYGRYSAEGAQGYYVHLWVRDAAGRWRIGVVLKL